MTPLATLATLLAVALGSLTTSPATAAPDPATTYAATAHAATNKARSKHDLVRLRTSRCLAGFARSQAERMASEAALSHQDLAPVMAACGLRTAGENVGTGFRSGRSLVVTGWLRSPGHRANILSRAYRTEAVAAVLGADGRWYVAQVLGRKS